MSRGTHTETNGEEQSTSDSLRRISTEDDQFFDRLLELAPLGRLVSGSNGESNRERLRIPSDTAIDEAVGTSGEWTANVKCVIVAHSLDCWVEPPGESVPRVVPDNIVFEFGIIGEIINRAPSYGIAFCALFDVELPLDTRELSAVPGISQFDRE